MLKVGDIVVVLDEESVWEEELDSYIGECGEVVEIMESEAGDSDSDIEPEATYMVLINGEEVEFTEDELDLADEEETELVPA